MEYLGAKIAQFLRYPLFLSIALCFSVAANAVPVVWTLDGVTFDDGGTASGSFTYDADTNTYSAVAITTTPGSTLAGASYNEPLSSPILDASTFGAINSADGPDYSGDPLFAFSITSPLTNSGGTIGLYLLPAEGSCFDSACTTGTPAPRRSLTAASVTATTSPPPTATATAIPTLPIYGLILTVLGVLAISARSLSKRKLKER